MQHTNVERTPAPGSPRFISALTKNTLALVLAGGRGSRLMQLTDRRAKPAVPFAGKFRIIDFPLSNCMNSGIRRMAVLTQYKAHSLIRHIQRGWGFLDGRFDEFIDILPASQRVEESWYKGTADAVFQNLDIVRARDPQHILILAGDHVYKMDYGRMLAFHTERQADMTVACLEVPLEDATAFGVMTVDENSRVVEFQEKPTHPQAMPGKPGRALASMGIYIFNARFLYEQLVRDADQPHSTHDFGKDLIPYMVPRYRVFAQPFGQSCVGQRDEEPYWRDVGTVDAYWDANMEMTRVTPSLNLYDGEWPIWTYQEQLPPAKFVFDDDDRRGAAIDSMVSGGCIVSGASVHRSLLFSNVWVDAHSRIEDSVILPDVRIGRNVKLKRVVVDKPCHIPDGMQIGFDLEEDQRRFYVSPRGVRLVTAEALGQHVHRHR